VPDFRLQVALQELGGEPEGGLALVDPDDGRRLIVAASEGARIDGVRRSMTSIAASAVAPELVVREIDRGALAAAHERLEEAVRSITPTFETTGAGVIYASFAGLHRRYAEAGEGGFLDDLRQAVMRLDLPVRVGMAGTRFCARAAAVMEGRIPGFKTAVRVEQGRERSFLSRLSVRLLPAAGDLIEALDRLGIHTLGMFAALPAAGVVRRFGPEGAALHRLACGDDRKTLICAVEARRHTVTVHAEYPVVQAEALRFLLRRPLEQLIGQLDGEGMATRCLEWTLQVEGEDPMTLQTWSAAPSGSVALWTDLVKIELDRLHCKAGVLSVTLEALEIEPRPTSQERLVGPRSAPPGALAMTTAHLAAELGPEGYGALIPRPSSWPEEREEAVPFVAVPPRRSEPAPIVSDRARKGELASAFRRSSPPELVRVELEGSVIAAFRYRGGRMRVRKVLGPWDVSTDWWAPGGGRARRYFQVEGRDGIAQIYFEPRARQWFLAGWLD
jgi:protein ImuB